MRSAAPDACRDSVSLSHVRSHRTHPLSPLRDPEGDSITSSLHFLIILTEHLDRDDIDTPGGWKTDDVLQAIDIAIALTELDLSFSDRRTLVNFIVALQLWATNPTKEALVQNDRLSKYLHQYEVDIGGDPDE